MRKSYSGSGSGELALGAQPVAELVATALLERDEVGALGDLGRAWARAARARRRPWSLGLVTRMRRRAGLAGLSVIYVLLVLFT